MPLLKKFISKIDLKFLKSLVKPNFNFWKKLKQSEKFYLLAVFLLVEMLPAVMLAVFNPARPSRPQLMVVTPPQPSPTPFVSCYRACANSKNCQVGQICGSNWCPPGKKCVDVLRCYNPNCPYDLTCKCTLPTPTPARKLR